MTVKKNKFLHSNDEKSHVCENIGIKVSVFYCLNKKNIIYQSFQRKFCSKNFGGRGESRRFYQLISKTGNVMSILTLLMGCIDAPPMNRHMISGLDSTRTRQIWRIWKLRPAYSPEMPNLGQNRWILEVCDLEIWWMTLKNNRASLQCYFKLCASFPSHRWFQTAVTVRKRPIWVKIDDF